MLPATVGADDRIRELRAKPHLFASLSLHLWNGKAWLWASGAAGAPVVPPGSIIDADAQGTLTRVFEAALRGCAELGRRAASSVPPASEVGADRWREIAADAMAIRGVLQVRPVPSSDQEYALELHVPVQRYALDRDPLMLRFVFPNERYDSAQSLRIIVVQQVSYIGCAIGRLISPEVAPAR